MRCPPPSVPLEEQVADRVAQLAEEASTSGTERALTAAQEAIDCLDGAAAYAMIATPGVGQLLAQEAAALLDYLGARAAARQRWGTASTRLLVTSAIRKLRTLARARLPRQETAPSTVTRLSRIRIRPRQAGH